MLTCKRGFWLARHVGDKENDDADADSAAACSYHAIELKIR